MSEFMSTFALQIREDLVGYDEVLRDPQNWDEALVRQAALVLGDRYYGPLYRQSLSSTGSHSESVRIISAAGCFDDQLGERPQEDSWFLSGPYDLLAERYRAGARNVVLVGTGSYDPMHNGHVAMMTTTRSLLESQDSEVNVVGAVMSSSHDSYVRRYKTQEGVLQEERIYRNQRFLEAHVDNREQWIIHDHWETRGVPLAVNFTDVLNHIGAMLNLHVGADIEMVYVFGSDAQAFAPSFEAVQEPLASAACVVRPGYPILTKTLSLQRCLIVPGGLDESSTKIRAREKEAFIIRGDAERSTRHLSEILPDYDLRLQIFRADLHQVFQDIFAYVEIIDVEQQLELTRRHLELHHPRKRTISADVYFTGDISARRSRLFHPGSSQHHSHGILEEKTDPSPTGREPLVFVDDDIWSGFTLTSLRQKYWIEHAVSMSKLSVPGPHLDIVDERDFLIGAAHGGLMTGMDGGTRFPYLSPFVDLGSRASVPTGRIQEVNVRLWNANRDFYAGSGLLATDVLHAQFLHIIGLGDTILEDICSMFSERNFS